jgi:DNA-binding CsgD family transcriptional regulator
MSILATKPDNRLETLNRPNYSEKQLKISRSEPSKQPSLLQAIIEGLVDGVLILTEQGDWIHANEYARRICHQLAQRTSPVNSVPKPIWRVCESLIDSRELFFDQRMIIESEIDVDNLAALRIRVRWLELGENNYPYLLVTIEDRQQSTHNAALTDVKKYGLTPREAEIWLLRRANYSYKEIADRLFITLNTVKKHMKNIYAKQEGNLWVEE